MALNKTHLARKTSQNQQLLTKERSDSESKHLSDGLTNREPAETPVLPGRRAATDPM